MRYLLDTHALIWQSEDSPKLPPEVKGNIESRNNDIFISAASIWEITIKVSLDKLKLNIPIDVFLGYVEQHDFKVLQIENKYLKKLADLPHIHKDPFDRMLVSTAMAEGLVIITKDTNIRGYDVPWVWQ